MLLIILDANLLTAHLQSREAALAAQLGCSEGQSQLECFRAATPDEFVDAALAVSAAEDENG